MEEFQYPACRTGDDIEEVAGMVFPDPYRWLEQNDEAVQQWQVQQNRRTQASVEGWPHFSALKQSVQHYFTDRINTLPRFVAGLWFRPNPSQLSISVSRTPFGEEGEISIFASEEERKSTFLSWISPSPDGRTVAVGVCSDGSENNAIQIIDVGSGNLSPTAPRQKLMDAWTGGVCWLPDSSGFYFLALEGEPHEFRQVVLFHQFTTGKQIRADIPLPDPKSQDYTLVSLSRDGRYLVASHGLKTPIPVAVRDLAVPNSTWRPFVTKITGTLAGFIQRDRFIALTDIDAPRGRIVSIPLDAENPNASDQWQELLAESEFVLRSLRPIGDQLYVTGFQDTYSEVRILNQNGVLIRNLPLPARGAIAEPLFPLMNHIPSGHPDEYLFVFSSFTESWGVYRHRLGAQAIETVRAPKIRIENAIVEDHWAASVDGVRVPYHIVRLVNVQDTLPAPCLIYAYGGFNVALMPEYPGAMAAFIAAGGIYVHGHIRGGAELGLDWWGAGRLKNKQNCYHDLYAIAEDLIQKGIATRDKLAMTGRSNGGLMAAVAVTQRPDLWRAIVCQVPVIDLIGMLRDPYGRHHLESEFGDPSDPQEIVRLTSFSPYHLVKPGTRYPAVYVEAGATDPRCPPWHARKFAALLQAASGDSKAAAVLLQVRDNAGHGLATAKAIQEDGYTGWLAFLMLELHLQPERRLDGH
jgi:prolyl oligopeptidase